MARGPATAGGRPHRDRDDGYTERKMEGSPAGELLLRLERDPGPDERRPRYTPRQRLEHWRTLGVPEEEREGWWAARLREFDPAAYEGPRKLGRPVAYATQQAYAAAMGARRRRGERLRSPGDRCLLADEHLELFAEEGVGPQGRQKAAEAQRRDGAAAEPPPPGPTLHEQVLALLARQRRPLAERLAEIDDEGGCEGVVAFAPPAAWFHVHLIEADLRGAESALRAALRREGQRCETAALADGSGVMEVAVRGEAQPAAWLAGVMRAAGVSGRCVEVTPPASGGLHDGVRRAA